MKEMAVEALKAKIKVCMFDQYGTVVDMQKGLTEVVTPYLREKGWGGRPDAFVTWWRRTHFENSMIDALLHKEHTPYREIGQRAVAYTLARAGIPHTTDEIRFLVAQIERLKPFPDVPDALARLKTRYKIAGALERRSRHAGGRQGLPQDSVRRGDLGRCRELIQTPRSNIHQGRRDHGREHGRSSLRRQPRLRLHRGQVRGHAFSIHRPSEVALRRQRAPAGLYCAGYEEPRRRDAVK